MNKKIKGSILLLIAAIIWGTAFVAQSVGVDNLNPGLFNGIRSIIGTIVLIPVVYIFSRNKLKNKEVIKATVKGGVICGIILCLATTIQTIGLITTTTAKAGFITALYMIFIPIITIFMGKKINLKTIAAVLIAVIGLYMLCLAGKETLSFGIGELQVLICSILFSFHILSIDKYLSDGADGIAMSCLQFAVTGILNIVYYLIVYGVPDFNLIMATWIPLVYAGAFSCGIAYTLQIVGQKYASPTPAAIIMSLESVFSAIGGWLILNQKMSLTEISGCVIMFIAIIIVQLPDRKKKL